MFERFLRLKVIVPALTAMAVVTGVAYVGFGLTGLVAATALWQLVIFGVLAMVARGHRLLLRSNREQLKQANQRLVDLETAAATRHDEVVRQLGEVAKSVRSERKQRVEEHRETQAWRKGVGAQLKALKDRQVTREQLDDSLREQADETAAVARNQYTQVEALINLNKDINPVRSFAPMAGWAASPDLLRFIYDLILDEDRSSVVECGTGVSTVVMAYAMRERGDGHVVAIDHLESYADKTRRMLADHELTAWADVICSPITEMTLEGEIWQWYDPDKLPEGPFDLALVDGPPAKVGKYSRYPAVPVLRERLSESAVIILDDYARDQEREVGRMWKAALPDWSAKRISHDKGTLVLRAPGGQS